MSFLAICLMAVAAVFAIAGTAGGVVIGMRRGPLADAPAAATLAVLAVTFIACTALVQADPSHRLWWAGLADAAGCAIWLVALRVFRARSKG